MTSTLPWSTVGCLRYGVQNPLWYASPYVSDAAAGLLPLRNLDTVAGAMNAACSGPGTDATRCAALSQMYGRASRQAVCVMGYPGAAAPMAQPPVLADIQMQQAVGKASVLAALSAVGSAPTAVTACVT